MRRLGSPTDSASEQNSPGDDFLLEVRENDPPRLDGTETIHPTLGCPLGTLQPLPLPPNQNNAQ